MFAARCLSSPPTLLETPLIGSVVLRWGLRTRAGLTPLVMITSTPTWANHPFRLAPASPMPSRWASSRSPPNGDTAGTVVSPGEALAAASQPGADVEVLPATAQEATGARQPGVARDCRPRDVLSETGGRGGSTEGLASELSRRGARIPTTALRISYSYAVRGVADSGFLRFVRDCLPCALILRAMFARRS
jgi:hypothetical protein